MRSQLQHLGLANSDREVVAAILDTDARYVLDGDFDADSLGEFVQVAYAVPAHLTARRIF
jgi:hypothetical protein